ncbi:MAG: division/cell wall cluster transcriptional repressor MraZ [Bacilli bacterium]|nr:division/cell wall cluster transcriptional repressor MraZ [Bacilli bacterium]
MGNFFGTYNRSLDVKNRLQVPSKLISDLPKRFYAIRGFEGCLAVYLEEDFSRLKEKLQSLSFLSKAARDYIRAIASSVKELEVDSHGRITVDRDLLEKYKISQEVTVVGVVDHFELWDRKVYEEYSSKIEETFEENAERLVP